MEVGRIGAGRRVSEFWRSQEAILKVNHSLGREVEVEEWSSRGVGS